MPDSNALPGLRFSAAGCGAWMVLGLAVHRGLTRMHAETAADTSMTLVQADLTYSVIGAAFTVHNKLGFGFAENVYRGAMQHECTKRGLSVVREVPIAVHYDKTVVGTYRVDLLIERRVIVEVKACAPHGDHGVQLLNYLRCTDVEVGLLLYFGRRLTRRRFIFRNALKNYINQTV